MGYLYGASVQGIQNFIFQTNELKDIVGASELVAQICTQIFRETVGAPFRDEALIIGAAGNVRYYFDDLDTCAQTVRYFPRRVMIEAPGITISQAVVEMTGDFPDRINELEEKLRSQRNQPQPSLTLGALGMKRSNKTGLPLVASEGAGKCVDMMTAAKRRYIHALSLAKKSFYGTDSDKEVDPDRYPYDIAKLTDRNDWIAIVHADGNSLGQIVQRIGGDMAQYQRFSQLLDEATERAANAAFEKLGVREGDAYPLRPVVLGGDDMTVIIRGSLAIAYAQEFIRQFEYHTGQGELGQIVHGATGLSCLTACAGIAFIKSSYPFHYGYKLAEDLCSAAKHDAKRQVDAGGSIPSCLMFHKVEDSYVESYADIVERVLMPTDALSFAFGPYYLAERAGYFTIDELLSYCDKLQKIDDEGVKSGLRQWLTYMHRSVDFASQHLGRMKSVYSGASSKLVTELCETKYRQREETEDKDKTTEVTIYPTFDVLSLYSIMNVVTKD